MFYYQCSMIIPEKESLMSRLSKYLLLSILIVFVLACSTVTRPIEDAQNIAGTAQSFATALPIETLKAFASQVPVETLQALPSEIPDFEGYLDPQGTPVSEWNGIPIMSQATAGEEFTDTNTYSFKVDASMKEVQDFYDTQMVNLGWSSMFSMPGNDTFAIQAFQKDNDLLTITITNVNGSVVVALTLA
jgi:hypothetical protein